jgi:hypothetical protein
MAALVAGLGECMATRYTVFGQNLWRVAVSSFNAVVETGLPAVNISYVNDDQPPGPEVWTALAHTFEWSATRPSLHSSQAPPPPRIRPPGSESSDTQSTLQLYMQRNNHGRFQGSLCVMTCMEHDWGIVNGL